MEGDSLKETEIGQRKENASRALRRKAELLGTLFGLEKPTIESTLVGNMPEEFDLPEEMAEKLEEIVSKKDATEVDVLVNYISPERGIYRVLLAIKGKENLSIEQEQYLTRLFFQSGRLFRDGPYLEKRFARVNIRSRSLNEHAAVFEQNGCVLYVGTGDIGSKNIRVIKIHPSNFVEFEKDPRTKFMLPKT